MKTSSHFILWVSLCALLAHSSALFAAQITTSDDEDTYLRDPFWPVGYIPANLNAAHPEIQTAEKQASDWEQATAQIDVSGVTRMGSTNFLAIINGQLVGEGENVSLPFQQNTYTWQIQAIESNQVRLARRNVQSQETKP